MYEKLGEVETVAVKWVWRNHLINRVKSCFLLAIFIYLTKKYCLQQHDESLTYD